MADITVSALIDTFMGGGSLVLPVAGAASTPALLLTGAPFTGGTGTTTRPLMLIEPTGATATFWATQGTMLGINAATGFVGNAFDFQINGVTKCYVSSSGGVTSEGDITARATSAFKIGITSWGLQFGSTYDVTVARLGPQNVKLAYAPSATPLPYTLTIGEASRPGTDSNVAGANGTIQSGLGTGTGTASSLIFQTPTVAGSGSGVQTYATRLTITQTAFTVVPPLLASNRISATSEIEAGAATWIGFTGRSLIDSPSNGVLRLTNYASTDFTRLQFGGTTAAFPSIKRTLAGLAFRLADDSADAAITALSLTTSETAFLVRKGGTLTNNAAAATATMTNAPVAGNPTKWVAINDNGTTRYIPTW